MAEDGQMGMWHLFSPEGESLATMTVEEIYATATEDLLARLSEDRRIERKPAAFGPEKIGEYLCMWSNTPCGGLIVVGMGDDGRFEGCTHLETSRLNRLEADTRTYCPDAIFECKRVPVLGPDGRENFVLLYRVSYNERRVVTTNRGVAYIRRGDEKHTLKEAEVRELRNLKGEVRHEQEPCTTPFPDGFDLRAIAEFAAQYRARTGVSDRISDVALLVQRHLGKRAEDGTFRPNVACALLFAKDPRESIPGCRVRFLRFEGTEERTGDRYNMIKDETIEGTVPQIIVRASEIIASQVRDFSWLGRDGKFVTAAEYPRNAWYEAVVNACAHRSYSLSTMDVFVRMFDDRIEIRSPGGFPPLVTPQNIYDTQSPVNPALMDALRYLDYVKAANEGTKRMRELMQRSSLPAPEFRQEQLGYAQVVVTLRNDVEHRKVNLDANAISRIGERLFKSLSKDERRLINFLIEHEQINVSTAMRLLGTGWEATKRKLIRLVDRGLLEHVTTKFKDPKAHFVLAWELEPGEDD